MALFQYSARNVTIKIKPINPLYKPFSVVGFGEGEFLTVELADDDYTTVSGADGLVVRSFKPNPIGNCSLTLQQTSPSNDALTFLRNKDKEIIGAGIFTLEVIVPPITNDVTQIAGIRSGLSTVITATGYISKIANYTYGKESGERQWGITLVNPVFEQDVLDAIYTAITTVATDVGIAQGMINSN